MRRLTELYLACGSENGVMPPTALFNEGWMLRLILDWFSKQPPSSHPLSFAPGSRWYSEALLSTQFRARTRSDTLAENWTHADGVIGHFRIGDGRGDVRLEPGAKQLVVVEAKMFSGFSKGTKRALTFDQASRNIACIAELLAASGRTPESFDRLGFVVLAPKEQVDAGLFSDLCDKDSIREKVNLRCASYGIEKQRWFEESFLPLLPCIEPKILKWEEVVQQIAEQDAASARDFLAFLDKCLQFNRPRTARPRSILT